MTSFNISHKNKKKNLISHFPVTAHLILHQIEGHLMVSGQWGHKLVQLLIDFKQLTAATPWIILKLLTLFAESL